MKKFKEIREKAETDLKELRCKEGMKLEAVFNDHV
jgi:hypothetical protein